jgi:hypothetical protein
MQDIKNIRILTLEKKYCELNRFAEKGGVVFFGSDNFAKLPVGELARSFSIEETVYNRSAEGINIEEAADVLEKCVLSLDPKKVFINLGDCDIKSDNFDVKSFISQYEWILYTLHTHTNAELYIVSLLSSRSDSSAVNEELKALALEHGCKYIDATDSLISDSPELRLFDIMKYYIRCHSIKFGEAMTSVSFR